MSIFIDTEYICHKWQQIFPYNFFIISSFTFTTFCLWPALHASNKMSSDDGAESDALSWLQVVPGCKPVFINKVRLLSSKETEKLLFPSGHLHLLQGLTWFVLLWSFLCDLCYCFSVFFFLCSLFLDSLCLIPKYHRNIYTKHIPKNLSMKLGYIGLIFIVCWEIDTQGSIILWGKL